MTKVIDIFAPRPSKEETSEECTEFESTEERNKANLKRVARERARANKSVLRSYRIKT